MAEIRNMAPYRGPLGQLMWRSLEPVAEIRNYRARNHTRLDAAVAVTGVGGGRDGGGGYRSRSPRFATRGGVAARRTHSE